MRQRVWSMFVTAGLSVLFASVVSGQAKGKPSPPPVPVRSIVADFDQMSSLLVQSDELGPYEGGGGVVSQVYSVSGDWDLDLSAQTARTLRLAFDPVSGSAAVPNGNYNARAISRCFDAQGDITGFLEIAEGSSNTRCSLRVVFTANGARYFLVMSPLYAGTDWATVSCPADTDANGTCEHWTIAPGTGTNPGVASLYTLTRSNKEQFVGSYYLSFQIDVTRSAP
jgi:hypothetical protein